MGQIWKQSTSAVFRLPRKPFPNDSSRLTGGAESIQCDELSVHDRKLDELLIFDDNVRGFNNARTGKDLVRIAYLIFF